VAADLAGVHLGVGVGDFGLAVETRGGEVFVGRTGFGLDAGEL